MIVKIILYDEDGNDFICSVAPEFRKMRKIDPFVGLGLLNGKGITYMTPLPRKTT